MERYDDGFAEERQRIERLVEEIIAGEHKIDKLPNSSAGFTGADLENLLNEAAINAAKRKEKYITNADVNYAFVKVGIGVEKRSKIISEKEKKLSLIHI